MNNITDPRFFTAGRAVFTVANNKGQHYTYRIGRNSDKKPLFVGLLTGPNNESDYTYMGILSTKEIPFQSQKATVLPINEDVQLKLTEKSKYTAETTPVKVLRWAIGQVIAGKTLPDGYSIQHEGKCCRCGRTLTTPDSVSRGWGPECDKHIG